MSHDKRTMSVRLTEFVASGGNSPVFCWSSHSTHRFEVLL